ncbi:MAG: glycoside hydrolase family 65 protein [Bacteroidales bacterium]|nr:glycoside hydrolase family 65 protein [Bacteroidales bacterium]MBN2756630.1 glycoside hydrolase family 65 protein [Bacteroidales bacterium]
MDTYYKLDEWNIIEEGFDPDHHKASESIFSIGNGRFGQRANFEENYTGQSLQGNYIAGVYYPDKTRVGWWKNGYPEYFAKVLNAANWIGINIIINGQELDLHKCKIDSFKRILNMKEGFLERLFTATLENGNKIKVHVKRFISLADNQIAAIKYSITPINFDGEITFIPYIDVDIKNEDSNYDEKFWTEVEKESLLKEGYIIARTKKTKFHVCTGMVFNITQDHVSVDFSSESIEKKKCVANKTTIKCKKDQETVIYKYVANLTSEYHKKKKLLTKTKKCVKDAADIGFEILLNNQINAWKEKWKESDIIIEGDISAQQGIRFNIFQLNQTYTGDDPRLNIGPKGFTGEKYGGSTYWDTEAYCLPFYLSTADNNVARNLLKYRYNHLEKAIENAEKLGFTDNAALYPMVTMNGEECHNEWEITFEEIHRNGAMAYAIYNYINYTGDSSYLADYGLEVLIAISKFWAQRVNYSNNKKQYVILGVTGPNEYENNVNNNWYTNYIASWTLKYTLESIEFVKKSSPENYKRIVEKWNFNEAKEKEYWKDIIAKMYLPKDENLNIILQQDGYLDKEQNLTKDLDINIRPINQNWSWDKILRSVFIKQADVLQGIFLFEKDFDNETITRNFNFYEERTVHESSLSACIHSIIASKIGKQDKAYELYLQTARLDLDDYNKEVDEGCHITSMAGTWMSIVNGFGGIRVIDNKLHLNPYIPKQWKSYSFKIRFREHLLNIKVTKKALEIYNNSENHINISVKNQDIRINSEENLILSL